MNLDDKKIESIKEYFRHRPVLKAYLFGSYVRGQADSQSDIDILVDLDYSQKIGLIFVQMQIDLEKMRSKRLLKQFESYKSEVLKPKGKLKEVRVEALRAGFKQCYQDKDFKSIVTIGDRIPNNVLMEDEVLLQFYDIASSRV
jgi:predicted nucleotidyltransferase